MRARSAIGVLLVLLFGVAMEVHLGEARRDATQARRVEEPPDRRLFLLILDSMRPEDAAALPQLQALTGGSFTATVEPCLERITYMCVKEALTGRSAFTLFGVVQNWGTAATDPGENLLRDARRAGRRVGVVSAGDLRPFAKDMDANQVFAKGPSPEETAAALALTATHDLVVYHYIWLDTDSHHHAVGSPGYLASLAQADAMVGAVAAGLPAGWDLLVTGDHGHGPDGRHVQGQDIPTYLLVRSPRVLPVAPEGRVPIHAVRTLAGAILGLHTDQSDMDPAWAEWLSPAVSAEGRAFVAEAKPAAPVGFPWVVAAVALGAVAFLGILAGWPAAAVALAAGVALGAGFEAFMGAYHFPGETPRLYTVSHKVSETAGWLGLLIGAALAWPRWRARAWLDGVSTALRGAASGLVAGAGALLLGLFPVVHHYGVLKNAGNIGTPLGSAALLAFLAARPVWWALPLGLGAAYFAADAWGQMTEFAVFNLEITGLKATDWVRRDPAWGRPATGALAALLVGHLLRPQGWGAAVGGGLLAAAFTSRLIPVHPSGGLLGLLAVSAGLFVQHRARPWLVGLGAAALIPAAFGPERAFGVLALPLTAASAHLLLRTADPAAARPLVRHAAAAVSLIAAYVGMAWSFGLSVTGIDYTFLLPWFPGRWHERLWFLLFIGTTVKCVLPVVLTAESLGAAFGPAARPVADTTGRWGWARTVVVLVFAAAWVADRGRDAAGLRLAAILQDAFFWMLCAVILHLGPPAAGAARPARPGVA